VTLSSSRRSVVRGIS